MSHRLKVTIKNESPYTLFVVDDAEETVLNAPSTLATGSNPLPKFIAAKPPAPPAQPAEDSAASTGSNAPSNPTTGRDPQSKSTGASPDTSSPQPFASFTIATPINGPTPEGYIGLQVDTLQLQAYLTWKDFIANSAFQGFEPCFWIEARLDGANGTIDVTVAYLDNKGAVIDYSTLGDKETKNAQTQKSVMKWNADHPMEPKKLEMLPVEVVFTLSTRVPSTIGTAPSKQYGIAPPGLVRPTGGSRIITGGQFPTWDTPGLSMRRKKLLAAIGSCFPMHDSPKEGDREMQSKDPSRKGPGATYHDPPKSLKRVPAYASNAASFIPYLPLRGWTRGMTSCTMVSAMIEYLLTGRKGKWGFMAPFFEEAWVPWGADPTRPMPNVGDVYLIFNDNTEEDRDPKKKAKDPQLRHVGFILHVPKDESEKWVTADGGQRGMDGTTGEVGGAAYLNVKPWVKRLPTDSENVKKHMAQWQKAVDGFLVAKPIAGEKYPYMIGGYESNDAQSASRMIGWLDIDSPAISFLSEEFDGPIDVSRLWRPDCEIQQRVRGEKVLDQRCTEADFRFLGAWINKMLGLENNLNDWIEHIEHPETNRAPPQHLLPWGEIA